MSDYLGPNQTRVLDSEGRSFESITYQKRKPPLSSEVNLGGKLSSEHARLDMRFHVPSGWAQVGRIVSAEDESTYLTGDVVTSSGFTRNTFKLIALNSGVETEKNIAVVNGWQILVQGTSTSTEDNVITLPDPPSIGSRVDFVFLEVWRKLIEPSDTVYMHGNVLYGGTNPSNDLIDPAIGIETSLRIQLQYRIRVAEADIESYPDGFDPNEVFVQGPLSDPISTCSHSYFSPVPGDPGLWRAGAGDSIAQETLQTVDGYTYAIPMFAVRRRNTGDYDPDTRSNGAGRTLANYLAGQASDRPDNLYNDWVVDSDILDMRHRVTGTDFGKMCEEAFQQAISGRLRGKMSKSTLGEDNFGVSLVNVDAVSNVDKAGSTKIATGDGIRRVFSNASKDQSETFVVRTVADKIVGTPNIAWANGDVVQINLSTYPTGSNVTSLEEAYTKQGGALTIPTDVSSSSMPTSLLSVEVQPGSPLIGTTYPLVLEHTVDFPAGPNGLTELPDTFLESRKEDSTNSIAMQDQSIRVRQSDAVVNTDGTFFNMLQNKGANITEQYDFGHQMVYHTTGNGTQVFTVPRVINGYQILGPVSITVDGSTRTIQSLTRTSSTYTINVGTPAISTGTDIEVVLYTGVKFFEGNKQGRAITDCWEMTEITPDETANASLTTFHLDTTNQAILGIASYISNNGNGYAYVNGTLTALETNNHQYPLDSTKTYGTIEFSLANTPAAGATIEVPILKRSAVGDSEGYSFFYETTPYQGLLDSSTYGAIEAVGPSIVTTAGSGAITDYTYAEGSAVFSDSSVIQGIGTEWASNVKAGYTIHADSDATKEYIIDEIYDDETLFLNVTPDASSTPSGEAYTITAKDQPFFNHSNIIDRLPTKEADNDSSGRSDEISLAVSDAYPVLETRIISRVQDITDMPANSVWIGTNDADRGRSTIDLPQDLAPLGRSNLGLKFEKLDSTGYYQKTYQSYVLNSEDSGRLYLMIVGSETDNWSASNFFNERSDLDSVDIFEIPSRPIIMKRIQ